MPVLTLLYATQLHSRAGHAQNRQEQHSAMGAAVPGAPAPTTINMEFSQQDSAMDAIREITKTIIALELTAVSIITLMQLTWTETVMIFSAMLTAMMPMP